MAWGIAPSTEIALVLQNLLGCQRNCRIDGRVRFEAAPLTAERVGLKLSPRLLALAERVVNR